MRLARVAFLLFLAVLFLSVSAAVPRLLTVQGRLKEAGSAVSGDYDITFYIYNTETGGSPLYTEAHTGTNAVPVSAGFFSVVLGEITPLTLPFKEQYWLTLKVGTDAEMTPRIKLTNSSYAFVARDLNVAGNLNIDSGTLYVDIANNRVGIGTTSPQSLLNINGTLGSLAGGLTFGDGDSGYYEYIDDQIRLNLGGAVKYYFATTYFGSLSAYGGLFTQSYSSAAQPTFTFQGDADTGMFRATTNQLAFSTGGNEAMRIDSSGNVGIGTTSPGAKLDIEGGNLDMSDNKILHVKRICDDDQIFYYGRCFDMYSPSCETASCEAVTGYSCQYDVCVREVDTRTTPPSARSDCQDDCANCDLCYPGEITRMKGTGYGYDADWMVGLPPYGSTMDSSLTLVHRDPGISGEAYGGQIVEHMPDGGSDGDPRMGENYAYYCCMHS